jgi:hypothetical protein
MTQQSAVYIGAGLDTSPLIAFPKITRWIFVDDHASQVFRHLVNERMVALGFQQQQPDINTRATKFTRGNVEVLYYFDTSFDEKLNNPELFANIQQCTVLVVMGHWPHAIMLSLLSQISVLILDTKTIYTSCIDDVDDVDDVDAIFHFTHVRELQQKFSNHIKIYQLIKTHEAFEEGYWSMILQPDTEIAFIELQSIAELIVKKQKKARMLSCECEL